MFRLLAKIVHQSAVQGGIDFTSNKTRIAISVGLSRMPFPDTALNSSAFSWDFIAVSTHKHIYGTSPDTFCYADYQETF